MAREATEAIVTDEVVEANVANMPSEADVVADTANVINKIAVAN